MRMPGYTRCLDFTLSSCLQAGLTYGIAEKSRHGTALRSFKIVVPSPDHEKACSEKTAGLAFIPLSLCGDEVFLLPAGASGQGPALHVMVGTWLKGAGKCWLASAAPLLSVLFCGLSGRTWVC